MKLCDVKVGQVFREIFSGKAQNNRMWFRTNDFYGLPVYAQVDGTDCVLEINNDPTLYKEQEVEIVVFPCSICKGKGRYALFSGNHYCSCLIGQALNGTYKMDRLHVPTG